MPWPVDRPRRYLASAAGGAREAAFFCALLVCAGLLWALGTAYLVTDRVRGR
jgi:hypothetical protein